MGESERDDAEERVGREEVNEQRKSSSLRGSSLGARQNRRLTTATMPLPACPDQATIVVGHVLHRTPDSFLSDRVHTWLKTTAR